MLPYEKDPDIVVEKWGKQIEELTGYKYISDKSGVTNG